MARQDSEVNLLSRDLTMGVKGGSQVMEDEIGEYTRIICQKEEEEYLIQQT